MPIGSLVEGLLATERLALADFAMFLRRRFSARLRILRLLSTEAWQHLRARERRIITEIDPHGVDL